MSDLEMSPSEQDMAYDAQLEYERKERIEKFGFDVLDHRLWKTFNSKKQVKSVPMTRGIYNKYQGWETPENENPEDAGYLIEYLDGGKPNHPDHDGYISWSPKEVFDRNHSLISKRGLTPSLQILDESPFVMTEGNYNSQNAWDTYTLHLPTLARAMTLGEYRKEYDTPTQEDSDLKGFAVRYPNQHPDQPPSFMEEPNFIRNYHLIGSPTLHIELDPNEPDKNGAYEKIKNASLSGGYPYPIRGAVAAMSFMDEASFYPNGVPMTIYKSKALDNGMVLGTVETLSGENGKLDFSDALRALKFGYRVQRSGWNGKDMWLSVSNLNTATVPADKFWSPHNSQYATENGGSAEVPPCITMKNAKGQIQMGWAPSPEDMFCSDWFVFEKQDEFSGTDDIAVMTGLVEANERALEGLTKPLTLDGTIEVDAPEGLADVKRERVNPSFTFASKSEPVDIAEKLNGIGTKFWSRDQELRDLAADFPDGFNSILVYKTLSKTTVGQSLGELLTYERTDALTHDGYPCVIANCKNGAKIEMEQEDFVLTVTFFDVNGQGVAQTYRKHNAEDRGALLLRAFYTLFPIPELGPYIAPGQRFQFDCADKNFVKIRDQLERFLDNGARATHGPHRDAMYETQLSIMTLLTKVLDTFGSDVGEHGEVLTNLSFAEALMFTASDFEIRHKDWKLGDKLTPALSDLEYVLMRTGEVTPWVATDEELRSDGWVLLYKED